MNKIDFKKELKQLYRPSSKKVEEVDVPEMSFLMIDGDGGPGSSSFQDAIEALYPVSYTLKFMVKKGDMEIDYVVMPLEGLWWSDDMSSFVAGNKEKWKWTLMIMQPYFVTKKMANEAINEVIRKKNPVSLPLISHEGMAAQIMHIGPYSEEGPTVEKVHSFIEATGRKRTKKHHEIYLSDIRRAAPEKWKTVIRQPMN